MCNLETLELFSLIPTVVIYNGFYYSKFPALLPKYRTLAPAAREITFERKNSLFGTWQSLFSGWKVSTYDCYTKTDQTNKIRK